MIRISLYLSAFIMLLGTVANAQNERKFIREGNDYFEKALADTTKIDTVLYSHAETAYRKALDKKPDDKKWNFNLGDALYKQMKFEEAESKFDEIASQSTDKTEQGRALHNKGNALMMQNKLDESIEAYKAALRKNPDDLETKYNLLYAMNLKKQQQQQQQNKDQNKDQKDQNKDQNKDNKGQNKDQNKDQNKNDQNKNKDQQNQDKNKDQQKKDQQKNDQDKQDQNKNKQDQQQQPNKISKENAERLLQALQNDEKKLQEKVKKMQAEKAKAKKTEKDW